MTPHSKPIGPRVAPRTRLSAMLAILSSAVFAAPACSSTQATSVKAVDKSSVVTESDPSKLSIGSSEMFFESSGVVAVTATDSKSIRRASELGAKAGVPVLLAGDDVGLLGEIQRLGSDRVVTFGRAKVNRRGEAGSNGKPVPDDAPNPSFDTVTASKEDDKALSELGGEATHKNPGVLAMASNSTTDRVLLATAKAAGVDTLVTPHGDPRSTSESVSTISKAKNNWKHVIGLGKDFVDVETMKWRMATAATGVELPGGGQLALPDKRYVALYGSPGAASLGALGQQDVPETIKRVAALAKEYEPYSGSPVIPTLEVIVTVASAEAGRDGDYSEERSLGKLKPLIDAAHAANQYVIIDLQPGRSSFLEQAKRYEELLALPYVGLALDPEWNLGPDEVHLKQIGTTTAAEINETSRWLADFVRKRSLPQKILVLHQFQVRMIKNMDQVDQSRSELAVVVHADGHGTQQVKQETWTVLRRNAPEIRWWGWKNFFLKDSPMLTPKGTAWVHPFPDLITYQ